MFLKIAILLIFSLSCASRNPEKLPAPEPVPVAKEFSKGELILGTQLLTKIFDQEMSPLPCVPTLDEASLLLTTIRPRMEVVQADMESMLESPKDIDQSIKTCDQSCICGYVDDLMRENLVVLTKAQRELLNKKKSDKALSSCLSYVQSTFCQSELYKELDKEKKAFSLE
ncbi:MAG TPA: hypothetical protein VNJ01_01310 [Bacteriovoracaceae bacterium]|nr:hypothetical protein [Bacteriovoracaceae bacterium]